MSTHVLVVGGGLTGATIARLLADHGYDITVCETRPVVSGQLYDPIRESGLRVHEYGPHAYHTNSESVHRFLSRFTKWRPYEHLVLASVNDLLVPVPCNFTTIEQLDRTNGAKHVEHLRQKYPDNAHVPLFRLLSSSDPIERTVAEMAYEYVFLHYTVKQWGMRPEEIGASVVGRVPIRMGYDARYFFDRYQYLPDPGYYEMIQEMLDHRCIRTETSTLISAAQIPQGGRTVFTGPADFLCEYELGELPYRSLEFQHRLINTAYIQPVAQLNYTINQPWTRITEFKHMTGQEAPHTQVAIEYSVPHVPGQNAPYYPIPLDENRHLHERYTGLISKRFPEITLAGRLADYRYYNMDQAVARGMSVATDLVDLLDR